MMENPGYEENPEVEAFIFNYDLDQVASDALRRESTAIQQAVMSQGEMHVNGNPSEECLQRIKQAKEDPTVEAFIFNNNLDEKASDAFRNEHNRVQQAVMSHGPLLVTSDPSGACLQRIQQARMDIEDPAVEAFIFNNDLDEQVSDVLRYENMAIQEAVMSQGPLNVNANPSRECMQRLRWAQMNVEATGGQLATSSSVTGEAADKSTLEAQSALTSNVQTTPSVNINPDMNSPQISDHAGATVNYAAAEAGAAATSRMLAALVPGQSTQLPESKPKGSGPVPAFRNMYVRSKPLTASIKAKAMDAGVIGIIGSEVNGGSQKQSSSVSSTAPAKVKEDETNSEFDLEKRSRHDDERYSHQVKDEDSYADEIQRDKRQRRPETDAHGRDIATHTVRDNRGRRNGGDSRTNREHRGHGHVTEEEGGRRSRDAHQDRSRSRSRGSWLRDDEKNKSEWKGLEDKPAKRTSPTRGTHKKRDDEKDKGESQRPEDQSSRRASPTRVTHKNTKWDMSLPNTELKLSQAAAAIITRSKEVAAAEQLAAKILMTSAASDQFVQHQAGGLQNTGSLPVSFRLGDWVCPICSNHNYASRQSCGKCRATSPYIRM